MPVEGEVAVEGSSLEGWVRLGWYLRKGRNEDVPLISEESVELHSS